MAFVRSLKKMASAMSTPISVTFRPTTAVLSASAAVIAASSAYKISARHFSSKAHDDKVYPFICHLCHDPEQKFESPKAYGYHYRTSHPNVYAHRIFCHKCKMYFQRKEELVSHRLVCQMNGFYTHAELHASIRAGIKNAEKLMLDEKKKQEEKKNAYLKAEWYVAPPETLLLAEKTTPVEEEASEGAEETGKEG